MEQSPQELKRIQKARALDERLDRAERDLTAARDLLMAIEVKLDILEGAAQVLDARTRRMLTDQ